MRTCGACSVNYPDAVEFCPRDGSPLPGGRPETQAMYDPLIGSTIDGRYIVEALLGQGGMGFVYAARHAIIDKRVAIKVLRAEHSQDEAAAERFLVEAKAASKIGHQNIVDITDFGKLSDGHAYFVMEFLDGPTLGKLVHEKGHISAEQSISITVQIARGLQAAHDKGIIHRDLKPENIFVLERDGQRDVVKIVDFGIARDVSHKKRLTQAGMVLGTPEYMSPEQATGQATDHRVDMYALGCILYEMLTGEVPYKGETPTRTLTMHVFDKVVPPTQRRAELHIPPALERVCLKMIEKKPADRFENLRETMAELDRVDQEIRGLRPPTPAPPRPVPVAQALAKTVVGDDDERPARSGGRFGVLVGVGAAVVVAVFGVALAVKHKSPPELVAKPIEVSPVVAPMTPRPGHAPAENDIEMVLHSEPAGADVFDGQERLGTTPVTVHHARAAAPLNLVFRRAGFHEVKKSVIPDRDLDIEVQLLAKHDRVADSRPHPARTPGHPTATSKPPPPQGTTAPKKPQSDLRNPFE